MNRFVLVGLALVLTCCTLAQAAKPHITKSGKASYHQLLCYEGFNQQGDSVRLMDYANDLSRYNFNNRASSCCFTGIWLLYDQINFNEGYPTSASFYGWGENYCVNFDSAFNKMASSARYVGPPEGYKYDTLNFYEQEHFNGREQYTYNDVPQFNYDDFGQSMIVTGCSPWTIYEHRNYQGRCACVLPGDQQNCYPRFFDNASSMAGFAKAVSSARRGCYCGRKIHPMSANHKSVSHYGLFAGHH